MGLGDDMQADIDMPVSGGISLDSIIGGIKKKPIRMLISGEGGVGKTSMACGADKAVIIDIEDGSHQLDIQRFPVPKSWGDIISSINVLRREDHKFKTLIIDSIDRAESMCADEACSRNGWGSIETPGFGKGYAQMREVFYSELLGSLESLQEDKSMNVLLVAHTHITNVSNPDGSDYTAHKLKLDKKIGPACIEWCDIATYIAREPVVQSDQKKARTMRHIMRFKPGATFDAKCRYRGMPDYLEMPENPDENWNVFRNALAEAMKGEK